MKNLKKIIIMSTIVISALLKAGSTMIKTRRTEFKYTNNGIQDFKAKENKINTNA